MANMKDRNNKAKAKKRNSYTKTSNRGGSRGNIGRGVGNAGKAVFSITSWLLIGLIIYSLLTGAINQRKTGETIVQYYVNISHKIANFINGNAEKPLKGTGLHMTEDGVYIDGYSPDDESAIENPGPTDGAPKITTPIIE